jgi:C4-type Zn-finger protein
MQLHEHTPEQNAHLLKVFDELMAEVETCPNCGASGCAQDSTLPHQLYEDGLRQTVWVCIHCGYFETYKYEKD